MIALTIVQGFLGLFCVLGGGPLWVDQMLKVFRGPSYKPINLFAATAVLALGLTLLGVTVWLSSTL